MGINKTIKINSWKDDKVEHKKGERKSNVKTQEKVEGKQTRKTKSIRQEIKVKASKKR